MFNPRHILITGASSGIGRALAELYAQPGVTLSLHGRNTARLNLVAESVRKRGADVGILIGDVNDAPQLGAWIYERDTLKSIDLVIANAGISAGTENATEADQQSRNIFATNMFGVLNTVQPIISRMLSRQAGQIAIVSSLAGFRGVPGASSYAASKAAVRVYGEGLRSSLAPFGVAVNVICPGFVTTPMTAVNPFRMPFIMTAERAAQRIQKGLSKNEARIAFPAGMYLAVWFLAALPQVMSEVIVRRMPRKPSLE